MFAHIKTTITMDLCIYLIALLSVLRSAVCQNPIANSPVTEKPSECADIDCPCCIPGGCRCNCNCTEGIFGYNCFNRCPERCVSCYDYGATNPSYPGHGYCTKCKPEYYNDPPDYFQCNYKCSDVGCVTCLSATKCHSCNKGYYLAPITKEYGECLACPSSCVACNSSSICSECKSQFEGETCENCKSGFYGENCNTSCPDGCKDTICEKTSGDCVSCFDGFTGARCVKCVVGRYGQNCDQTCPVNCRDSECGRDNGYCTLGCVGIFKGNNCDQCIGGKHGIDCTEDCPENCYNQICIRDTGHCNSCKTNFQGDKCYDCQNGWYGSTCSVRCPTNCKDNVCGREGGICIDCEDGFHGTDCTLPCQANCKGTMCERTVGTCMECIVGFYGLYCNHPCSVNCNGETCDQKGVCDKGCKAGYSGDRCCVQGSGCLECSSNYICSKCVNGKHGETCQKDCSTDCGGGKCNKEDGACIKPLEPGSEPQPLSYIIGGTMGGLAFIAIIAVLVICMYKRRQRQVEHTSGDVNLHFNVPSMTQQAKGTEVSPPNVGLKLEIERLRMENVRLKDENLRLRTDQNESGKLYADPQSHYTNLGGKRKEENTYEGLRN